MSPVDFDGLRIFDYTAGQSLGSSVAAIEVAPGARHAEAWSRRSDKYYLVSSGEVRFVLEGELHTMKAGDFCFVAKGRRFSYSNESSQLATLVLVHTPSFDLRDEVFVGR
jgi:mannose-6-phosphate isomerase-like protein (cupin superfamily)